MKISINSFKGIAPKIEPRYLPDGAAQVAVNVIAEGQSVRPLRGVGAMSPAAANAIASGANSLYRGWLDYTGDDKYWLSSASVWDVCRSQIAGDVCEWTFISDPTTYLKATNSILAIYDQGSSTPSTGVLPRRTIRMGIPAPEHALTGWVNYAAQDTTEAILDITSEDLDEFITYDFYNNHVGFFISIDKGVNWYYPDGLTATSTLGTPASLTITAAELAVISPTIGIVVSVNGMADSNICYPSGSNAAAVAAALNGVLAFGSPVVSAVVSGSDVVVTSNVAGRPATLTARWWTTNSPSVEVRREAPGSVLPVSEVVTALNGTLKHAVYPADVQTGSLYYTAAAITMPSGDVGVRVTGKTFCRGVGGALSSYCSFPTHTTESACVAAGGTWSGGACFLPALTTSGACAAGGGTWVSVTDAATCIAGPSDPVWISGELSLLSVKWGAGYAQAKDAQGTTEDKGSYESRVYAFTWIYTASLDFGGSCGWTWESAPSPPSEVANVYVDSTVYVKRAYCKSPTTTAYGDPPQTAENCALAGGTWTVIEPPGTCSLPAHTTSAACTTAGGTWTQTYKTNGLRLYRSVAGQYLLVAEGSLTDTEYTDSKKADELGEPCPSILWSPPPSRTIGSTLTYLSGIINLPNGMVAGFLGRDVYFAEPYRPFAWPETYIQTLDDPIVGLGRMDTTLAVLTTGTPYFIQGSHPENVNVVKADLEQSCVSKRSIVSMGRSVFYASPDGLMMLTPSGSGVITEALFDRTYWQALVPANIHAYGHDGKYVAFFGTSTITVPNPAGGTYSVGGFVLDTVSKQFYLHSITCRAGYRDLHNDSLFLSQGLTTQTLAKWGQGTPLSGAVWRSKMFSMPQSVGFACGQVEAGPLTVARDGAAGNAYPITLRVYVDGVLFMTKSITNAEHYEATKLLLSRRAPFRLPPLVQTGLTVQGRDWEIELDVTSEIFNLALANAMSEIAGV